MAYMVVKVELAKAQLAQSADRAMGVIFPDVSDYLSGLEQEGWTVVGTVGQGNSALVVTLHRPEPATAR